MGSPCECARKLKEVMKVLLRERKRHTDRGVSSTPSVVLYEYGVPPPLACRGYPPLSMSDVGGTLRWGTPPMQGTLQAGHWGKIPFFQARSDGGTQGGVPPHWGTSPARSDGGYPKSILVGIPHPGPTGVPEVGYTPRSNGGGPTRGGVSFTFPHYFIPVWLDLAGVPPPP